ncbi:MAG: hypothetical protein ACRD16_03275, partial [Thermoanaerobaculia bacterium]
MTRRSLSLPALLALGALAAPGTLRSADSLAPGEASGTFSLDGKVVLLHHAYAMTQPSDFEEKKTDTAILLTENAVPEEKLRGLEDLERAGEGNSLFFKLDETGNAIREVVRHTALGDASLQMSGMTHSVLQVAAW